MRQAPHSRGVAPSPHPSVLSLFRRSQDRTPRRALPILDTSATAGNVAAVPVGGSCTLASCRAGSWAMVVDVRCGDQEACRLRAIGLCEGARVNVVASRNAVLLEVRGTRIALGRALGAGITVRPIDGSGLGALGVLTGPAAPAPAPAR